MPDNVKEADLKVRLSFKGPSCVRSFFFVLRTTIPLQKSVTVPVARNDKRTSMVGSKGTQKINDMFTVQREQVFLGMIASSIQPKREVSQIVQDLKNAGIRFVYFSPRHMRRSKSFVEKMGINLDWNSAISLRTIDEGKRDICRMAYDGDFGGRTRENKGCL